MLQNKLAIGLMTASIVLLAGILLYMFGTPTAGSTVATADMQAPSSGDAEPQGDSGGTGGVPSMGEVVEGEVPAPDPSSPLAIEIPGCKCHSDDPEIVAEHEQYRMNQCAGCHMGGTPMDGG